MNTRRLERQEIADQKAEREGPSVPARGPVSGVEHMLRLQRSMGNQAVVDLLRAGQAKLEVGAADHPSEREADEVARHVADAIEGKGSVADQDVMDSGPAISRVADVGVGGGPLSTETSEAIESARGGGVGLSGQARSDMESAFGRSLADIRLHAGPGARDLNERVQAKAFTVGNDIFFRDGIPGNGSRPDRELLAHELTHTIQQGGGQSVGRKTIRRMAFQKTKWDSATSASVSSGGALGVLIVRDNTEEPVVVKAGESFGNEAAVAGQLLNSVAKGSNGWSGASPDARSVEGTESATIYGKVKDIWERRGGELTRREQTYLDKLQETEGVMIYGFAKGREMKEILEDDKQTKKGFFGSRKLRKGSVAEALFSDPGLMTTMGQAQAVDVITSNRDRLLGMVNLENFLIDLGNKRISLIDNINARTEAVMADMYRDGELLESGENGFKRWAAAELTKRLQSQNFKALAKDAIENLSGTVPGMVRGADQPLVRKSFQKNKDQLEAWFSQGLAAGRSAAIEAISDTKAATANVASKDRLGVATNLLARKYVLEYFMSPEQAWAAAQVDAPNVLGIRTAQRSRRRSGSMSLSGSGNGNDS